MYESVTINSLFYPLIKTEFLKYPGEAKTLYSECPRFAGLSPQTWFSSGGHYSCNGSDYREPYKDIGSPLAGTVQMHWDGAGTHL